MSAEISISEHNQAWIRRKMVSGNYASADEVISVAPNLLEMLDPESRESESPRTLRSSDPVASEAARCKAANYTQYSLYKRTFVKED